MTRRPFDAHLCAQGSRAALDWERGFQDGGRWATIAQDAAQRTLVFELVRNSDDVGIDWSRALVGYHPYGEGWMLGAYGVIAGERL